MGKSREVAEGVQVQALVVVAPTGCDFALAIEDHVLDAVLLEARTHRKASGTCTDHQGRRPLLHGAQPKGSPGSAQGPTWF